MCTAISFRREKFYFCRNLDYFYNFGEEIVTIPRHYKMCFTNNEELSTHYAIIGMAKIKNGYPLLFDGCNERGLCIAGLNFEGYAKFCPRVAQKNNLRQYEIMPYILSRCKDIQEATDILEDINITSEGFDSDTPPSPLHYLIADREKSIVFEFTNSGGHIYENVFDILTNNPPFEYHRHNMANYMHLSCEENISEFGYMCHISPYSNGMGAMGLPGDYSSPSRFVRGAFVLKSAKSYNDERKNISQCFHILSSVEQPYGCVRTPNGYMSTLYSSVIDTENLIYYCKKYDTPTLFSAKLWTEHLEGDEILRYTPMAEEKSR